MEQKEGNGDEINISDLFENKTTTTQGYKLECPDCGLQGDRTEGFILNPDTNIAYCHSSHKWFKLLEAYALKKKIIRCIDGREKGDTTSKVLGGELFTLTLDEFKSEYGTDMYNRLIAQLEIRKSLELPGNGKLVSDFCDELGDIYKSRNILFYRSESKDVVEIGRKKIEDNGYIETGFKNVSGNRLITLAEMLIKPWTTVFMKNGGQLVITKSMSQSLANQVLDSKQFQEKLPIISRIFDVQIPIIYKGVLTFPKRGYDQRFNSWLSRSSPNIIDIPLEDAILNIENIYKEFPFKSNKDKNKAIAGLLTPFLRGLFKSFSTRTPVFIYMANRERAGKDYCANINGIVYEGEAIEEPPICSGEQKGGESDELRKKITASMLQGKKRMHFSNNKGMLNNATFESVTTLEIWHDRVLGRNDNVQIPNEMDFSLSGNIGLRLSPDMANRSMIINLHLVDENANARKFSNPYLHQWVKDNRSLVTSSLFALVKNWFDKGCPKGSVPFTSFPQWAEICGGIMEAAGYENPILDDEDIMIPIDSETEEMKILFEVCYEKYKNTWVTKQELQKIVEEENIMSYFDFSPTNNPRLKSSQTSFGLKIDKFVGRELGNIIMRCDNNKRPARRKYVFEKNNGNPGIPRQPFQPNRVTIKENNTVVEWMPDDTRSPKENVVTIVPVEQVLEKLKNENRTIDNVVNDFKEKTKILEEYKKKNIKIKTDRELQYWESPECAGIVEQCTKEQVLEWIMKNPGGSYMNMYDTLGIGCFKYTATLIQEGIVKKKDDGWEVVVV